MSTLSNALYWLNQGITPIPCAPKQKRPIIAWEQWQHKTPTHYQVVKWFQNPRNLALMTGTGGLLVLDFDTVPAYYKWKLQYPELAGTYTVKTRRGRHAYFFTKSEVSTFALPGIDVLGNRHIVMAPPSIHPSGIPYQIYQDAPIQTVESVADIIDIPAKEKEIKRCFVPPPVRNIPGDSLVAKTKRKLSLLRVLSWYTQPLHSRDGRWWIMRCPNPAHADKNPSFWADAQLEICSCFKLSCKDTQPGGLPMDIFNLVQWLEGVSNKEAIRLLAQEAGII